MRPSRYAVYCETSVSTRWSCHSMILVSGSSVTSVRNALPSTRPSIRTDSCFEAGNSGLVTLVGSENDGLARSTRLPSGAQPVLLWVPHPRVVELGDAAVDVVALAGPGVLSSAAVVVSTPHAATTVRPAASASAGTPHVRRIAYFPIVSPLRALLLARSSRRCVLLVVFHFLSQDLAVPGVHDHLVEPAVFALYLHAVDDEAVLVFELGLLHLAGYGPEGRLLRRGPVYPGEPFELSSDLVVLTLVLRGGLVLVTLGSFVSA